MDKFLKVGISQKFAFHSFDVGDSYGLSQIFSQDGSLAGKNIKSGSILLNFENCNLLLVNLLNADNLSRVESKQTLNCFDQGAFFWQAADLGDSSSPCIKSIIEKTLETVIFCRLSDQEGGDDLPFVFCGSLLYEDHQDISPVNIRFRSLDFRPSVTPQLDRIFEWRPSGYRRILSIQNYDLKTAIIRHLKTSICPRTSAAARKNRNQGMMDQLLFGKIREFDCALCHKKLPISLLQATYIKPRSQCHSDEILDSNNLLPLCKLGCHQLFVQGFLVVDDKGFINKNRQVHAPQDLRICLNRLSGKKCLSFDDSSAGYFRQRSLVHSS